MQLPPLLARLVLVWALAVSGCVLALPVSAAGDTRELPGNFTGYAFDTCDAPSQRRMDAWRTDSIYAGIGIYVAGMNRACSTQRHLTASWVATQARNGWRLLPLVVGRQASCAPAGRYVGQRISPDPQDDYARATRQGRRAARAGAKAARQLGIGEGSVLWYDLEHFDSSRDRCRRSALHFTSGWTRRLDAEGYRSGFYSSASSGIAAMEHARVSAPGVFALPDYLWIAEWNGKVTLRSRYLSQEGWWPHRRVHQYRGDHLERHGGVRLNVDSNVLSTGEGTIGGESVQPCGVRMSFRDYPHLERGDRGSRVRAAQCLLRERTRYDGELDGRFGRATAKAVRRFQHAHPALEPSGELTRRTWAVLITDGRRLMLKYGSGGNAVRRLQRGLNAFGAGLEVDGVFARAEHRAVRRYERSVGQKRNGVVTPALWDELQHGRR